MGSIDEEKKKLADSVPVIAQQNGLEIAASVLQLMFQRQEHCRGLMACHFPEHMIAQVVEQYNKQIKSLLQL